MFSWLNHKSVAAEASTPKTKMEESLSPAPAPSSYLDRLMGRSNNPAPTPEIKESKNEIHSESSKSQPAASSFLSKFWSSKEPAPVSALEPVDASPEITDDSKNLSSFVSKLFRSRR